MNLIKQLGGYEAVKGFYERAVIHGFKLIEVRDALLEHRRVNNIYEVGDLITHPAYDWKILKVHDPIPSEDILFAKTNDHVKHHWGQGLVFDGKYVVGVSYNGCRHATPQEIGAGRRL